MTISMGQYYPTNSVIHKLDPRLKISLVFLFLGFVFISKTFLGNFVSLLFLLLVIILSKIPFKIILKSLKPLIFIMAFTLVANILFVNSGKVLLEIGFLKITVGGILYSLRILIRLMILIIASSMLTFTTPTLDLADGIESLLNPLKKIKFPSHEISMMITIALRFIPTIAEELDKIKKAQMSRGADFETGGILKRVKSFIPILIPLFVSSFKRADELAIAMEARCYRGDLNRTKMKIFKLANKDYVAIFIGLIYFALIIILRFTVER